METNEVKIAKLEVQYWITKKRIKFLEEEVYKINRNTAIYAGVISVIVFIIPYVVK